MTGALPLAGYRILSAEQYGAGPYGTMFLGQLGAEVIKIEQPGAGDSARAVGPHFLRENESLFFQSFNLNKRSLTLDLNTPEGKAILHRLAASSHAVVNNLRGDLPGKIGLTYAHLKDANPALVCAHLSAYGRDNERARWPGYDYLMQAEAGFMAMTGDPSAPPTRFGLSIVDFMTGTMMAIGLLAALVDAQQGSCAVIHSDDPILTQRLNQEAAAALSAGRRAGMNISQEHAIGRITLNAARSIGIDKETGSLEPGKRADVVIWSADPFSIYARADQVFIDGGLAYDRANPAFQPVSDFELGQPGFGQPAAGVAQGAR